MRTTPSVRFPLAISALSALLTVSGAVSAQQPKLAHAKEAGAPQAQETSLHEISLPVTGLTQEDVATVKEDLLALATQVYACPSCDMAQAKAGTCPKCQVALQPETLPVFTSVASSSQDHVLALTPDPRAEVRLSQIEAALSKHAVKVDDEHFLLSGRTRLVIQSTLLEDPKPIESALTKDKLFAEAKLERDAATSRISVKVRAATKAPPRAAVVTALQEVKARLIDVIWDPTAPMS